MAIIKKDIGRNCIVDAETGEILAFFDGAYVMDTKRVVNMYCKKNGYRVYNVEFRWDCVLVYVAEENN